MCVIKCGKLIFKDYKHCLEPTQLENKLSKLEKNRDYVGRFRENHKIFIKKQYINIKIATKFRRKKHNVVTEEVNKIALSVNDDKII